MNRNKFKQYVDDILNSETPENQKRVITKFYNDCFGDKIKRINKKLNSKIIK